MSRPLREFVAMARRRWPVAAALLLVVLVIVAVRSRRDSIPAPAEASGSTETAAGAGSGKTVDSVVTLDSAALRLVEIQVAPVAAYGSQGLLANGTITFDANHASVVAPRAEGRIAGVRADLGQRVSPGSILALIESQEVGQARGELARARASLDVAQKNYEREKRLFEQSISSQREVLEAEGTYKVAQAEYTSTVARISGLGARTGEGGVYGLESPISGEIVERNAMPGQVVGPANTLFTVADLRHVWITVDVYENNAGRVRRGAVAIITPRALPDETFRGRVTYAGGVIDTASRTLKVRVEVDNAGLRLRPGMFAEVRIEGPADPRPAADRTVLAPELAVQDLRGATVVFVPGALPGRFIARRVTLGARAGSGLVTILLGLRLGDTVVTKGAFQLKAELTKASFGEAER